MRLQLLRLLQSFARAIYLVICYRLKTVYCRLVYMYLSNTLACIYFYSLIVCSMSKCCVNFNMKYEIDDVPSQCALK